jgi:hypothetical protein
VDSTTLAARFPLRAAFSRKGHIMKIPAAFLRGAAIMAVGAAVITSSIATPVASAAPDFRPVDNDNSGGGVSDVPIIGDLVGSFEGQEPEDIAVGAIQMGAGAAEIVVPIIIRAFK